MSDLSGKTIRGYELKEQLGAGGFGAVYSAYQPLLKRDVAIKIILPHLANDPEFIRRFEVEAELVARLEHPHIVPLFDYWREPDSAYLVLRLLRGGSLKHLLEKSSLSLEQIATLLDQICAALHVAHRNNVIHRDIKPDNILLDEDGNAYLTDFGIAKSPNLDTGSQPDAMGTLLYMSPEQLQGLAVSPQSDIYALGILLYEMLAGQHPYDGISFSEVIMKQMNEPLPDIRDMRDDLSGDIDDVIQTATKKEASERYADVRDMARAFRAAIVGEPVIITPIAEPVDDESWVDLPNPYLGLQAFQEADKDRFFGRQNLVERLLERMAQPEARFLAVVGPSGSGKSSVVKAGLLPALRQGQLQGSENWFITEMFPGTHPFEELEAALLKVAINLPDGLLKQLREDERGLVRAVKRILPADDSELLLVIDQFEELFTLVEDEDNRALFLENLLMVVGDSRSRIRIIVTLRADFYDKPLHYHDFGELLRKRMETVLPLTPDELQQAIVEPAEQVGARLQTGLVDTIIRDVSEQPGMLPLLQYALTELFERRSGITMTLESYSDIGGVTGALARRAEEIFMQMDETGQTAIRQMFLRLVTLGEGTEDTRRRVRQSELPDHPQMTTVLDHYGQVRLLTFDRDPVTRSPTVEVAHEALIRTWERLREWVADNREGLRIHRRLTQSEQEWQNATQDESFLATGARLSQFEAWAENTNLTLNDLERDYLNSSIQNREERRQLEEARKEHELELQTQAANRLRYLVAGMTIFVIVALGLSLFAFNQQRQAELEAANAETQADIAEMNANDAATSEANAIAAQATSDANADIAAAQATTAYTNLIDAQNVQALFLADLAQQELAAGHLQDALHLALESINMRDDDLINIESREALFDALIPLQLQRETFFHPQLRGMRLNRDETKLVTWSNNDTIHIWSISSGEVLFTATHGRRGEPNRVRNAMWNADETKLLTWLSDGTVKMWDVASGNLLREIQSAEWNGDETRLLTWSSDDTAQIWDDTLDTILFAAQHDDAVRRAEWNGDETRLLTWSSDGTAKVWDIVTGNLLFTARHDDAVGVVAEWNADETRLLTRSSDGTAKVWDTTSGELLFSEHNEEMLRAGLNAAGTKLFTLGDLMVQVWDVNSRVLMLTQEVSFLARVTWSSDGTQLLIWSPNGSTVWIWDVNGGTLLFTETHDSYISNAWWNSDETQLFTWSWDDNLTRIWDVASGNLLREVQGAEWNEDETRLLTWSADGLVQIWDSTSDVLLFTARHDNAVRRAGWNGDETQLFTLSTTGLVQIWDVESGNLLFSAQHDEAISGVMWNADETQLFTWSWDDTVRVWDLSSTALLVNGRYDVAAWNSSGTQLLTWLSDSTINIWDTTTGDLLFTARHDDDLWRARWNSDETQLLIWSWGGAINIWDTTTGDLLFTTIHDDSVRNLKWNSDETRLLTWSREGAINIWDTTTGDLLFTARHDSGVQSARWNRDETQLLTISWDGTPKIWDTATGDLLFTARHDGTVSGAEWNSDETQLLTWSSDGTAKVWDTATGDSLFTARHDDRVQSAEWNSDETRLLTWSWDGTAKVWDTATGDLLFTALHDSWVEDAGWNSDETRLLTSSLDGTAKIWDTATGDLLFTARHDDRVQSAGWNSDETRLLTWSWGDTAKVWDTATGDLLFTARHDGTVNGAEWNRDETRLLTWSWDGTAKIWDTATGDLLSIYTVRGTVGGAEWNSDETQLLTWSGNQVYGEANIWDMATGDLLFTVIHNDNISGAEWSADETLLLTRSSEGAKISLIDFDQLLTVAEEQLIPELFTNQDRERFFLPTLVPTATSIPATTPTASP